MFIATPPDRSDSPTSQQSVQSSQASDPYAWIDQMAGIDRMELFDQMAEYLYRKWLEKGDLNDIEDAVYWCETYIDKLPEGHPDRANMESRLVTCLTEQYIATKAEKVLCRAIVLAKKLYDGTSKDDAVLSNRANNYAILLGNRYNSQERQPDDLNKSIELAEEAVDTAPQAGAILHQEKGAIVEKPGDAVHILNTLCGRLEERFLITGSLADLDRAIGIWTKLVEAVSQQDSQGAWPTWLSNLSASLLRRYEQSEKGDPEDLRRSIDLSRKALECIGDNDPYRAEVLCTLTHPLAQRAVEVGDTKGMGEAIKLLSQELLITPDGHPRRIEIGFNLAMRLFQCSQMTSNSEEKRDTLNKKAVRIATLSLKFTPENHPIEPHLHNLIGLCCFYARIPGSPSERDSAAKMTLENLEKALNNPSYVPVYRRVQAGRLILRLCCERGEWKKGYETSVTAVRLIPKITSRSIRNADKQRLLSLDDVVGFSADAAAAALNAGRDGYAALDLLEMGRGLLAASVAEPRADLAELRHKGHTHLAERFVALRDQLQMSSHQQYQVNLNFDALLDEIRGKPGFENFLGPLRRKDIHHAALDGPVVVLSASELRGVDAILVQSDDVQVLRFAKVTMEQLEVRSQNLESLELLEWLWDVIVGPIMDALGFTSPPVGNSFSRIWWIPTGILSRFPLHAAGRHSTSTDTVMDRVMSSYSPSIKALLRVRRRSYPAAAVPKESKALLVAMTETPQLPPLSHVFEETRTVERLLKAKSCSCIVLNKQPRKESVFQHLEACQIFHFAGHGHEDIFDPSRSALLLHDWEADPMTVDSVLGLNLSEGNCFLAYLSACETGQVTRSKFHDETIHIISAYQLAGFRHVIGTLWSNMTDVSVCRGLHAAAMRLRDESRNEVIKRAARREKARDGAGAKKPEVDYSSEDEGDGDLLDSVEQFWIPYVHFGV
ncbi:CHAT domain containing protein [Elaphomyces granulatus]